MNSLYTKLITDAEEELKQLIADNQRLKEKLAGIREMESVSSVLEGEISSLIMMSHMESTKQIYAVKEELKREEEREELLIAEKLGRKQRLRHLLLDTIRAVKAQTAEL